MNALDLVRSDLIDDAFDLIYLVAALGSIEGLMQRNAEMDHIIEDAALRIEPRLQRKLVSVAGNLRNFVFENPPVDIALDDWEQASNRIAGNFTDKNGSRKLLLGDACSRILHAKSIEFKAPKSRPDTTDEAIDCAYLTGAKRNGEDWAAVVNIPVFASAAYVSTNIIAGVSKLP